MEQSYEKAAENYRKAAELRLDMAVDNLKEMVEEGHISEEKLDGLEE